MDQRYYGQHQYQWKDSLTCRPIDTYSEIHNFVENPPAWRSLCKELTPHSKYRIKNSDINQKHETCVETPEYFCHFDPDADGPKRHIDTNLPKVLVCHDMANGYHDDSYVEGTENPNAYTFYNWTGIDIFCYFSHHLITIPPLGWINAAHAHGVKVIGTVITEWAEGFAFWEGVLASEQEYKKFASALVAIAKILKFEGWLLNVENKVSAPDALVHFVHYLHRLLHEEIPHAELIWYDSVTVQGALEWQNGLNEKNRAFFDACDGIFTNYSWSEGDVASSAAAAGDRRRDVYVGLDVWGRNFYGGGRFNTFQAAKTVSRHACSMAIFAPAWTLEALGEEAADGESADRWRRFLLRDRALWGSLWVFLKTRLPRELPFRSSFCKGQGDRRRLLGEVVGPRPWHDLRAQQYQPNAAHGPHGYRLVADDRLDPDGGDLEGDDDDDRDEAAPAAASAPPEPAASTDRLVGRAARSYRLVPVERERECLEEWRGDAFTGGSCLRVHPSDGASAERRHARLFLCDLACRDALAVCVVTKPAPGFEAQHLDVQLRVRTPRGARRTITLAGGGGARPDGALPPLEAGGERFRELRRYLLLHEPDSYVPLENAFGWQVRYYVVRAAGARVESVDVRAGLPRGCALLGYVGLCEVPSGGSDAAPP